MQSVYGMTNSINNIISQDTGARHVTTLRSLHANNNRVTLTLDSDAEHGQNMDDAPHHANTGSMYAPRVYSQHVVSYRS